MSLLGRGFAGAYAAPHSPPDHEGDAASHGALPESARSGCPGLGRQDLSSTAGLIAEKQGSVGDGLAGD